MATFLEIAVNDSTQPKRRTGLIRFRISDATFPAGVQTNLSSLIGHLFGASLPIAGGMAGARIVIGSADTPTTPSLPIDIRNLWKVDGSGADTLVSRFQLPAANPLPGLLASGSVVLADLSSSVWTSIITDLLALGWEDPKTGETLAVDQVVKSVRARVRPRIGSVR